ncbi:uncharacterized protein LOC127833343 isoform X1 [Dreissena polymorpha]|uniref:TNF family profile domain-containing protein n=1 Tax=Dreissena polymorpha TaxID=45954 RepID=A0A9D4GAK1_DREPO|nr:uncharacterized protein LOC127833343 isoform X1 [Dreissena polymorpha]KAH3811798.1 hypothetical protein DPMN_140213 [Dreissena polymorpha]
MTQTVSISTQFNNYYHGGMKAMTTNATKRRRLESNGSEASGVSTQTQLTDLSGSSPDDNSGSNLRRNSDKSDSNSTGKNYSTMPEMSSNCKCDAVVRERMFASRKESGHRVSFSLGDSNLDNEENNGPFEQFGNSGRKCNNQHTIPISRPRQYSENNEDTVNKTCCKSPLNHYVSMPYTPNATECECSSCFDRTQNIAREHLQSTDPELTFRKSLSVRSLPDIQFNGIPFQYPVSNQRQVSKTPLDTVVNFNETRAGKYLHTVFKNQSQHKPRSLKSGALETIYSGDTPSSTFDNRPFHTMPGVDQSFGNSEPRYEMVEGNSSQPRLDSPVSSKQSSESSRSEKCLSCNKFTVLVILNVVLMLLIVPAVTVYVSVIVGNKLVSEPGQMNKTCVSCSVLDIFDSHEELGLEKRPGDLCCLKADTNLVDFIIKTRRVTPTSIKAEDEEIYHGRPILELKSVDLDDRKVRWNPRGLMRGGLALNDSHKIEFNKPGYYFVSTELAFKPNSQEILQAEFTFFGNENKDNSKDKPLRSKSETLRNQPNDSRYNSQCSFVDFFSAGSHLYVKLDHVEGLLEKDAKILIFFLGN